MRVYNLQKDITGNKQTILKRYNEITGCYKSRCIYLNMHHDMGCIIGSNEAGEQIYINDIYKEGDTITVLKHEGLSEEEKQNYLDKMNGDTTSK